MTTGSTSSTSKMPNYIGWEYTDLSSRANLVSLTNVVSTRLYSGANDPLWRDKIAKGESATNPYLLTGRKYDRKLQQPLSGSILTYDSNVDKSIKYTFNYYTTMPVYSELTRFEPVLRAEVINLVQGKAFEAIYEHHNRVNGFGILGELRKTIHGIRHPAEALVGLTQQYVDTVAKNKRVFAARKHQILRTVNNRIRQKKRLAQLASNERKLASNLWLEYRFGWIPLVQDVEGIVLSALNIYEDNISRFNWYRVKAQSNHPLQTSVREYSDNRVKFLINDLAGRQGRAVLLVREKTVIRPPIDRMTDLLTAVLHTNDIKTLVPALWDLTPLSVFVDYFVNVNQILVASITETTQVDHVELQYRESINTTSTTLFNGTTHGNPYSELTRVIQGKQHVSDYRYQRQEWQLSIPMISFTSPIGSPIRLANLAAFFNNVVK